MNITLSNRQKVNTKLVSSPVKLRRARITKFDKISEHVSFSLLLLSLGTYSLQLVCVSRTEVVCVVIRRSYCCCLQLVLVFSGEER